MPKEQLAGLTASSSTQRRYVLDIGQSEDWLGLQVALSPCLLGYGAVASMLYGHSETVREGNHYWNWIENYVADDYVQAVKTGSGEYTQPPPTLYYNFSSLYAKQIKPQQDMV